MFSHKEGFLSSSIVVQPRDIRLLCLQGLLMDQGTPLVVRRSANSIGSEPGTRKNPIALFGPVAPRSRANGPFTEPNNSVCIGIISSNGSRRGSLGMPLLPNQRDFAAPSIWANLDRAQRFGNCAGLRELMNLKIQFVSPAAEPVLS